MDRDVLLLAAAQAGDEADRVVAGPASIDDLEIESLAAAVFLEIRALRLTIEAATTPGHRRDGTPAVEADWYDVEIMGHRSRAGRLEPVTLAGRELVQIAEPAHRGLEGEIPERIEVYAASAFFALAPSTEEAVLGALVARDSDIPF